MQATGYGPYLRRDLNPPLTGLVGRMTYQRRSCGIPTMLQVPLLLLGGRGNLLLSRKGTSIIFISSHLILPLFIPVDDDRISPRISFVRRSVQ